MSNYRVHLQKELDQTWWSDNSAAPIIRLCNSFILGAVSLKVSKVKIILNKYGETEVFYEEPVNECFVKIINKECFNVIKNRYKVITEQQNPFQMEFAGKNRFIQIDYSFDTIHLTIFSPY